MCGESIIALAITRLSDGNNADGADPESQHLCVNSQLRKGGRSGDRSDEKEVMTQSRVFCEWGEGTHLDQIERTLRGKELRCE